MSLEISIRTVCATLEQSGSFLRFTSVSERVNALGYQPKTMVDSTSPCGPIVSFLAFTEKANAKAGGVVGCSTIIFSNYLFGCLWSVD